MTAWCMEHPFLATFIVIFGISAFTSVVESVVSLFRKVPTQPTTPPVEKTVETPTPPKDTPTNLN
jgi:hypothetical protein